MTRDQQVYRLAYWVCCAVLAFTFLSAGYFKVLDPPEFAAAVYSYQLLPDSLVNVSSLFFQWLEIVCGVCLLFIPRLRVAALWTVLVLLIVFSSAIGINLIRGAVIDCGCFSKAPDAEPMNWMSVIRNLILMVLAVLGLIAQKKT